MEGSHWGHAVRPLGIAGSAKPIEHDVVVLHFEPLWNKQFEIARTTLEFKEASARTAVEVVMVGFPCDFVARGFARNVNGDKIATFREGLEVAVHGCDTDPRRVGPGIVKGLLRRERTAGFLEYPAQRAPLRSVSFSLAQ